MQESMHEIQDCSINFNEQIAVYYGLPANLGDRLYQSKMKKYVIHTFWNVLIAQAEHN